MCWKHVQQGGHELVVVEGAVKVEGKAAGHGGVVYVEARLADSGEDVVVANGGGVGLGFGGLVVDGVGVDEGDGEASWCELDG